MDNTSGPTVRIGHGQGELVTPLQLIVASPRPRSRCEVERDVCCRFPQVGYPRGLPTLQGGYDSALIQVRTRTTTDEWMTSARRVILWSDHTARPANIVYFCPDLVVRSSIAGRQVGNPVAASTGWNRPKADHHDPHLALIEATGSSSRWEGRNVTSKADPHGIAHSATALMHYCEVGHETQPDRAVVYANRLWYCFALRVHLATSRSSKSFLPNPTVTRLPLG